MCDQARPGQGGNRAAPLPVTDVRDAQESAPKSRDCGCLLSMRPCPVLDHRLRALSGPGHSFRPSDSETLQGARG